MKDINTVNKCMNNLFFSDQEESIHQRSNTAISHNSKADEGNNTEMIYIIIMAINKVLQKDL